MQQHGPLLAWPPGTSSVGQLWQLGQQQWMLPVLVLVLWLLTPCSHPHSMALERAMLRAACFLSLSRLRSSRNGWCSKVGALEGGWGDMGTRGT